MVRVVRETDGTVTLDRTGKKPGRGTYVCARTDCLEAALRRRALERSLKGPVPVDLWDVLRAYLEETEKGISQESDKKL